MKRQSAWRASVTPSATSGGVPSNYPGFQPVSDPANQAKFEKLWGVKIDLEKDVTKIDALDLAACALLGLGLPVRIGRLPADAVGSLRAHVGHVVGMGVEIGKRFWVAIQHGVQDDKPPIDGGPDRLFVVAGGARTVSLREDGSGTAQGHQRLFDHEATPIL